MSDFYAKGRGGLQPGASRDSVPPWGPPQSRPRRWEFRTAKRESRLRCPDFFTAKCESRPPRPDFFTAKCESRLRCPDFFAAKRESRLRCPDFFTAKRKSRLRRPGFATAKHESRLRRPDFFAAKRKDDRAARTSSRRSAKADNDGRLCPGGAFSAARPAGTARFLITRGKASFYETATFGRRKVFFCSPFCGLLFCPTRAKLALPAGEKPAAPKPRPPRGGPAQRPRPAPGFCAASANARPGDPAPVRLLEKALWVPPTTEPFRPAPSGKPERKKERRNPG